MSDIACRPGMMVLRTLSESGWVAICHESTGITSAANRGTSDLVISPL